MQFERHMSRHDRTLHCSCNFGFMGDGVECTGMCFPIQNNNTKKNLLSTTLTEIDECESNNCSSNATCVDKIGEFGCTCDNGFVGDGHDYQGISQCKYYFWFWKSLTLQIEIDECDPNSCSFNGTCHDMIGYYNCSCNFGFIGDGIECTGIWSLPLLNVHRLNDKQKSTNVNVIIAAAMQPVLIRLESLNVC